MPHFHPNSFPILSFAISINDLHNRGIGLRDISHRYKLLAYRKGVDLYTLAPDEPVSGLLITRKTTEKGWKDHAVVVSGDWPCPELQSLPMRRSFNAPGTTPFPYFLLTSV